MVSYIKSSPISPNSIHCELKEFGTQTRIINNPPQWEVRQLFQSRSIWVCHISRYRLVMIGIKSHGLIQYLYDSKKSTHTHFNFRLCMTSYYCLCVMIPPWSPSTVHARQQEGYDKEELLWIHVTSDKKTQEDYELEPESWQISCLVSTDTFGAGHDTGDVWTERMKITWSMIMWDNLWPVDCIQANKISHGGLWRNDRFSKVPAEIAKGAEIRV